MLVVRLHYPQIINAFISKPTIVKAMENDEKFKNEIKELINGVLGLVGRETK